MRVASLLTAILAHCALGPALGADDPFSLLFMSDLSEVTDAPTTVEGVLPSYMQGGTFIHNGCGSFEMGSRKLSHIFDCFAKLHSWTFNSPTDVTMSSAFLTTKFYMDSLESGDIKPEILFGLEEPRFDMKERTQALMNGKPGPDMYDNNNVNLWDYGVGGEDSLLALTDSAVYVGVSKSTLEGSEFVWDNFDTVNNGTLSSAHPGYIPGGDKTSVNFFLSEQQMVRGHSTLNLYKQTYGSTHLDVFYQTKLKTQPYVHSLSVTDNFVVMAIYGSSLNEMCVMGGMTNAWEGVNSCFQWEEGAKTRVLVVDHGTGELWKDEELDESFFSFHHVNAYEEDGKIVLDLIAGSDSSIIQSVVFQNEVMMDKEQRDSYKDEIEPTVLKRVVLEKKRGAASVVTTIGVAGSEDGNSYGFDFPLVNPLVRGRKHCFVYGASGPFAGGADEYEAQALVKVNLCEGDLGGGVQAQVLTFPGHALAGDMSFVPDDREGADEDDGVILQVMLDGENTESYLRVIDAKTMDTVATIYNERDQDKFIAPFMFHSIWVQA